MTKISLDKKYHTRSGCEVKLHSFHEGQQHSFIGEYKAKNGIWIASSWTIKGYSFSDYLDLVEVKEPQYVYLNVYSEDFNLVSEDGTRPYFKSLYASRQSADKLADKSRVGCLKVLLEERFDD